MMCCDVLWCVMLCVGHEGGVAPHHHRGAGHEEEAAKTHEQIVHGT